MRRWEKIFWALVAGAAIGAAGCGDDTAEYGPPSDAPGDGMEVLGDVPHDTNEEEPVMTAYGPFPDF